MRRAFADAKTEAGLRAIAARNALPDGDLTQEDLTTVAVAYTTLAGLADTANDRTRLLKRAEGVLRKVPPFCDAWWLRATIDILVHRSHFEDARMILGSRVESFIKTKEVSDSILAPGIARFLFYEGRAQDARTVLKNHTERLGMTGSFYEAWSLRRQVVCALGLGEEVKAATFVVDSIATVFRPGPAHKPVGPVKRAVGAR